MNREPTEDWQRGCVQVYTGDGKGKTTAALGLALRAAGAGLRVFIGQFVKGAEYSELRALERFRDRIEIRQFGRTAFIHGAPTEEDIAAARAGLRQSRQALTCGEYRLVILDEANVATHFELIPVEDLLAVVRARASEVEVVITGRRADPRILECADLVTEMREVRHYFAKGIPARRGIEN